jgi:hypothetical protein
MSHGHIYFITDFQTIKIGFSKSSPARRMVHMQTGHPLPLYLVGSIPATKHQEAMLHRRFEHLRTRGEWFRVEYDLLDYIEGFEKDGTMIDPKLLVEQERKRKLRRRRARPNVA